MKRKKSFDRVGEAVLMLKVFNGCIKNKIIPGRNSPCEKRLIKIIASFKPRTRLGLEGKNE